MKNKLYKILTCLFITAIFYVGFFSGSAENDDGKIHLKYWYVAGPNDVIPYRVTQFNSTQEEIFVDATPIPWNEHEKKVLTAILSGDPPDVVSLVAPVKQWASRMALLPLDKFISRDNFDTNYVFPALWKEVNHKDQVFALPTHTASYAFFYNKKLFREAGLDPILSPKTWDEVKEFSKSITRMNDGKYETIGFLPAYGNLHVSVLMANQLGAEFLTDRGSKVHLDNPELVKSLEWMLDYYNDYDFNELVAFQSGFGFADQHGFLSEKIAMMILDHTFLDGIEIYKPNLDYGVSVIPTFKDYPNVSSTGNWWMGMPRGAKNSEAAWEFMKFSVRKDIQIAEDKVMKQKLMPANMKAAKDTSITNNRKFYEILIEQMEYAKTPSIVPLVNGTFWREFAFAQERVIRKIQSPKEALEQGNKVIQAELDRAVEYDEYVWKNMKPEGF